MVFFPKTGISFKDEDLSKNLQARAEWCFTWKCQNNVYKETSPMDSRDNDIAVLNYIDANFGNKIYF